METKHIKQMDTLFKQRVGLRQIAKILNEQGVDIGHTGVNYWKNKLELANGKKYPKQYLSLEELKKLL